MTPRRNAAVAALAAAGLPGLSGCTAASGHSHGGRPSIRPERGGYRALLLVLDVAEGRVVALAVTGVLATLIAVLRAVVPLAIRRRRCDAK